MPTITVRDQSTSGKTAWNGTGELTLDILTEEITVRELIRARVYQEVQDFNLKRQKDGNASFRGLVQPTDAEVTLNGYKMKTARQIDWKPQFEKACDAFQRNGFILLLDDRQAASLDEQVMLTAKSTVTFLRLVPLVGG